MKIARHIKYKIGSWNIFNGVNLIILITNIKHKESKAGNTITTVASNKLKSLKLPIMKYKNGRKIHENGKIFKLVFIEL